MKPPAQFRVESHKNRKQSMSPLGHSRHFRPVRRMSACPLTAAREQTLSNRTFGPEHGSARAFASQPAQAKRQRGDVRALTSTNVVMNIYCGASASGQLRPQLTRQNRRSRLRPHDGIGRYVQGQAGSYSWRTHHFKACFHKACSHHCPCQEHQCEQAYDGE